MDMVQAPGQPLTAPWRSQPVPGLGCGSHSQSDEQGSGACRSHHRLCHGAPSRHVGPGDCVLCVGFSQALRFSERIKADKNAVLLLETWFEE